MKLSLIPFAWAIVSLCATSASTAKADSYSIEDYNRALPVWGTSWHPGSDAVNGYYPSFYTGFAPRSSFPSNIHVRLARGNQTRVSVVLDEQTVSDYIFDLAKRYQFYKKVTAGSRPLVNLNVDGTILPQLEFFTNAIESDRYGILPFVDGAQKGNESAEAIYQKSLSTLSKLNPGRVFEIRLDLTAEFLKWRSQINTMLAAENNPESFFANNPAKAIIALNSLVFGRVNYTEAPSGELISALAATAELVKKGASSEEFTLSALELFKKATGSKFAIRVLDANGQWKPAIECASAASCTLTYPEFTAVYPTGSVKSSTKDQFGNTIPTFATPGLWRFLERSGGRGVDNIRDEPFYGWAPKMDYEDAGNGFHNPAVRFTSLEGSVKSLLGIPASHNSFWSVMRGGVSHGCSRLPLGHVWEMRHIFPVDSAEMSQIYYFGSDPKDFDVYDIDGNGTPEVIGVEYLISYGLQQADGLGSREGSDLEIGSANKLNFYKNLYGAKNVFTTDGQGNYTFSSPSVSMPSYLDFQKKKIQARLVVNGNLALRESAYERDKVQFYVPSTRSSGMGGTSKKIIRLMGKVRGCAPTTNKEKCGEASFEREAAKTLQEANR